MLTEVAVQGFRCFDASEWHRLPLTRETIIMGPNNSGKSALLSVVDFYRASFWGFPAFRFQAQSEIHRWGTPSDHYHPKLVEALFAGRPATMSTQLGVRNGAECVIEATMSSGRGKHHVDWITEQDDVKIRSALQSVWHLRPVRQEFPISQTVGTSGSQFQPLWHDGKNAIQFLLERYTSRDPDWDEAEVWLKQLDPHMNLLSVPLRGQSAAIETARTYPNNVAATVNVADQGTGLQSVLPVVAALVFSSPGSTIILEEPEAYLHPRSQEVVVDLMNKAVNEWGKQVIATTHSWDIILPFVSDIGEGRNRGGQHAKADPENFSLVTIDDDHNIEEYELAGKKYTTVRADMKKLWG